MSMYLYVLLRCLRRKQQRKREPKSIATAYITALSQLFSLNQRGWVDVSRKEEETSFLCSIKTKIRQNPDRSNLQGWDSRGVQSKTLAYKQAPCMCPSRIHIHLHSMMLDMNFIHPLFQQPRMPRVHEVHGWLHLASAKPGRVRERKPCFLSLPRFVQTLLRTLRSTYPPTLQLSTGIATRS